MARVSLEGVTKRYGDVVAVRRVSLRIEEASFVSVLGPSGSGKTTVLRLVAGFVRPDEGDILIGDRRVNDVPSHRRNIGMVFQHYALFPHMTVFENVAFGLDMRGIRGPEASARVHEALALVRLTGLEGRYPRALSGGQQQRVALARSIVIKPALLLLDEPLSALDRKLRAEMQVELRQLQQTLGITTLYVTHDQEEALALSDRIAILRDGTIAQEGTPRQIYEAPASAFVADFLGTANLLDATLARVGDRWHARIGGLAWPLAGEPGGREGDPIRVALRPERIRLSQAAPAAGWAVEGKVANAIYLGTEIHYHVEVAGCPRLVVRAPSAGGDAGPPPERGDAVHLAWRAEDALVIRD